jgi:hypothetical protein
MVAIAIEAVILVLIAIIFFVTRLARQKNNIPDKFKTKAELEHGENNRASCSCLRRRRCERDFYTVGPPHSDDRRTDQRHRPLTLSTDALRGRLLAPTV